jgi:large subunit ribosomal protein L25
MAEIKLHATTGRALGNGPSRRIRAEGKVPAVVYGLGGDPVAITVDWRPLRAALTTEAGLNALIDLEVDGTTDLTIIKEMQRHPIRGNVMHVDFLRVDPNATITVDVPIVLEGEAKQVTDEGGTVDQVLFSLSVNAKPADIPNELTVDISGLTLADPVRVSDITLPAGVTTDVDSEEAIASGQIIAAEPAADAGDAEGEAGEAAAAPAEAEAAADGGDGGDEG